MALAKALKAIGTHNAIDIDDAGMRLTLDVVGLVGDSPFDWSKTQHPLANDLLKTDGVRRPATFINFSRCSRQALGTISEPSPSVTMTLLPICRTR